MVKTTKSLDKSKGLHAGEASVLVLAEDLKAVLVSDDPVARTVAKAKGIPLVPTTFFHFSCIGKKSGQPPGSRGISR